MNQKMKNENLANDLKEFLEQNRLIADTRIYFNGMAYGYDYNVSRSEYTVIEDIVPSDYFDFADDESVCMTFEGKLYHIINHGENDTLFGQFDAIFDKHDCFYEFGNMWNLTVHYI